jgi:His-Xaa-Ser system radical SAM maturase HxsB
MPKPLKLNPDTPNFFRFKKIDDDYLITNDLGHHLFLSPAEFSSFTKGKVKPDTALYDQLKNQGFLKDDWDLTKSIARYQSRSAFMFQGPSLHIIVTTLRCNYKCVYCQASSRDLASKGHDMNLKTAKRAVDLILASPSQVITIEFQGGEPLVNWPVVKFIVEYSRQKNKKIHKILLISLVTNLSLMDKEKFDFLADNRVSVCTSLDGPEEVHNLNRPFPGKNSYKVTSDWIKKIKKIEKERQASGKDIYHLSSLVTVSKESLKHPKEIVDEYRKWGFEGIHLRQLSYLGAAGEAKNRIGYSVEDFLKFWKRALDYIIDLNLQGKRFYERGSRIMLQKIMQEVDPGFTELRSPCGAVTGQILYNYDGKVYSCDEGRMCGDDTFAVGDLGDLAKKGMTPAKYYRKIINNQKTKTLLACSTLDNTQCDYCAYKPYCGICPVMNYMIYGNLFPAGPSNDWCKAHSAMFDYLFKKLKNKKAAAVFRQWLNIK